VLFQNFGRERRVAMSLLTAHERKLQ